MQLETRRNVPAAQHLGGERRGLVIAEDAGAEVIGYASQARFLLNCGLAQLMGAADLKQRTHALRLVNEHEMGELFKVLAFAKGCDPGLAADAIGFVEGDRSHTL